MNKKKSCVGMFLDMSKAFDCVIHKTLLYQLDKLGIRGITLKLLESYLKNRDQYTVIDSFDKLSKTFKEVKSDPREMLLGLPQGSILGPLLFLVYVNELPNITNNLCVMFADDATIFIPNNQNDNIKFEKEIIKTLNETIFFLKSLNLTVNLSKTKVIQFRNYKTNQIKLNITSDCKSIVEIVDDINFLGVNIDSHLNWKLHITKINNKISSYCYALSILAETSSVDVARAAYFGQVYPLLTYGVIFWGNSVNVKSTFILQKKCLRTIYSMYSDETLRNVFREKGYLTLTGIYVLEMAVFIKSNIQYFELKSTNKCNLRKRYAYDLSLPNINNALYHKSAYITGIQIFNHLPTDQKASVNLSCFKMKLKRWLIDKAFYSLTEYFGTKTA